MPYLNLTAPPFDTPTSSAGLSDSSNNVDFVSDTVEFSNNGFSSSYELVFDNDGNGILDPVTDISFTIQRRSVAIQLTSQFYFSGSGSGNNEYQINYIDGTLSVFSQGPGTVYSAATSLWTASGNSHALRLSLVSPNATLFIDGAEIATFSVGTINNNAAEFLNIQSNFDSVASTRSNFVLTALSVASLSAPPPPPPPPPAPSVGTGIRFPVELPLPLRDGYAIGFEETRSSLQPESGHGRNRRIVRTQPRVERLVWSLSQEQFRLFDLWWQFTIESGAREFDLLLTDTVLGTAWFTARWFGNYQAEMTSDAYRWRVSGVVRLLGEPFAERPSGTDELRGASTVGIAAGGNLLVERLMYASAVFDLTARARLSGSGGFLAAALDFTATSRIPLGPLRGACTVGITAAADASQFGIGAPQVARVWTGMQFWRYGRSSDINANNEAVRRSAMGLTNGIY